MGSLGKQEEKHRDILDAELETGFGEQQLKQAAPKQIRG